MSGGNKNWIVSNIVWISGSQVLIRVRNEFTPGGQQKRPMLVSMGLFGLLICPIAGLEARIPPTEQGGKALRITYAGQISSFVNIWKSELRSLTRATSLKLTALPNRGLLIVLSESAWFRPPPARSRFASAAPSSP
jgi:hypothetical protein